MNPTFDIPRPPDEICSACCADPSKWAAFAAALVLVHCGHSGITAIFRRYPGDLSRPSWVLTDVPPEEIAQAVARGAAGALLDVQTTHLQNPN